MENETLDAMDELGSYLVDSKVEDWNAQVAQETCGECGTELKHRQKERQIGTWVSDMNYKRDRCYCSNCKKAEYPLDKVWAHCHSLDGQKLLHNLLSCAILKGISI